MIHFHALAVAALVKLINFVWQVLPQVVRRGVQQLCEPEVRPAAPRVARRRGDVMRPQMDFLYIDFM